MIASVETKLSIQQRAMLHLRATEIKLLRAVVDALRGCHIDHFDSQSAANLGDAMGKLSMFDQTGVRLQPEPEDPLDTPLPCDVKVAHMTFRKGVSLRLFVEAAARWHKTAVDVLNSQVRVENLPLILDEVGFQECLRRSSIDPPAIQEPIVSETDQSAIQNEPGTEPAYRAAFSSEGSMAYQEGGGQLETIIVPD